MPTRYSVTFINRSPNQGTACLYQAGTGLGVADAEPLAWLTQPSFPGSVARFTWAENHEFMWAQTGLLAPGVPFVPSQAVPADPNGENQVTFACWEGVCGFQDPRRAEPGGSLTIRTDGSIALNDASVGIGMSGSGTFAVQAKPNAVVVFTPRPQYRLAFGNFVQGQVLQVGQVQASVAVEFPEGSFAVTAALDENGAITIQPSS